MVNVKIKSLELENFRGIEDLKLDFDGRNTVFYGINGSGKSTILSAITILYSRLIQRSIKNKYKLNVNIENTDIMFGKSESKLMFKGYFMDDDTEFRYMKSYNKRTKERRDSPKSLDEFSRKFHEYIEINDDTSLPIFMDYGVHRVVLDIPLRINKKHTFDRVSAFERAVESKIDFRTFFEWFRNQEDYENEIKVSHDPDHEDFALKAVKDAIYFFLEGFSNLRVQRNPLRMVISKGNVKFEINQLSDGEKCILALVGDLARRLALANPKLDNPLDGTGIVLIDEVELHMHPGWQRKVLPTMFKMFPNVQFFITTHSPQVLGEINENTNIFCLNKGDSNNVSFDRISNFVGWDSNYILDEFMGVSTINLEIRQMIDEMYEKIENDKLEDAMTDLSELERLTNGAHEDVIKAKILIQRKKRKK